MTLAELETLLNLAKTVAEVFGDNVADSHRDMAAICHPDKWSGTPEADQALRVFKLLGAWKARADSEPVIIKAGGKEFLLHGDPIKGDLCNVYFASTADNSAVLLKIPRVTKAENLMAKERELLIQIHENGQDTSYPAYFPSLIESLSANVGYSIRMNVFEWLEGLVTSAAIHERQPSLDGRHIGWMFNRLLVALGFVHKLGWIHGAVIPPHVLFRLADHRLQLVDWIHAVQVGKVLSIIPAAYRSWYPPEVLAKKPVTGAVDIYMAAKLMLWLGSSAMDKRQSQFLKSCMLESPGMRGTDAWGLQMDWSRLLEQVYGPPKFHNLDI